jgi:kynurenine 3-monooxygenase
MVHSPTGQLAYQPYGIGRQAINSFSRGELNLALVRAAGAERLVTLRFERRVLDVDLDAGTVTHVDAASGGDAQTDRGVIVGADGAYSVVRAAMQRRDHQDYSQQYLAHGYKELTIPPDTSGGPRLERNALHIWPRGGFMMMAMANPEHSFTVTLYLPMTGPNGFDRLTDPASVRAFFEREFPDAIALIPDLTEAFFENRTGSMVTVRTWPWQVAGRAVLVGDAGHAIVPFYGQGANAGFEDCLALIGALEAEGRDTGRAFERFQRLRKPHTEAIADLAIENFHEMRDHVASPLFRVRKRLERLLHRIAPRWYIPLYTLISFTLVPYADARNRARRQGRTLRWIGTTAALAAGAALVWWLAR